MTCSIGIVTALDFEARALETSSLDVRRCALAGRDAAAAVRELVADGHRLIVSWGTAGALSPEFRAGDICLPEQVITRGGLRIATDSGWRARFLAAVGESCRVSSGMLVDSPHIVAESSGKRELRASTGAGAVDMESGPIGEACRKHAVSFLVVRAIVDELEDRLPAHIARHVDKAGTLRPAALLGGFILRPGHWGTLLRLGRRYGRARASLNTAAAVLGQCIDDEQGVR